jgi:uncharacterized HAD superfamily protein
MTTSSKNSKKIIAVDIDEVLADFFSYFVYFHNLMYKTKVSKKDMKKYYLNEVFEVDRAEMHIRYMEFKSLHLLEQLNPVKGAVDGLKKLIEMGFDLHLVTARPQIIEEETRKWLSVHFKDIYLPIHFTHPGTGNSHHLKKSEICKEIGAEILIDDHMENALDCAENGIKVFLMDAPWNQTEDLPPNVVRVKSWKDITALL